MNHSTGAAILASFLLLTSAAQAAEIACTPPPAGMTAWWPADGNAKDIVGATTGTIHGPVTYAPSRVGQGFTFAGAGSVDFGTSAGNFGLDDFSVDLWMNATSHGGTGSALIEKRAVCALSDFWSMRIVGDSNPNDGGKAGQLVVELNNTSDPSQFGYNILYSGIVVNDGANHHITLVRVGVTAWLYVDGVLRDSKSTANVIRLTNAAPLQIGRSVCENMDGTIPLTGQIDEIEIFQRALSATEVNALATAQLGKCLPTTIDIKPGSCPNTMNLGSEGVTPVSIYGSALLDVTQIDQSTLTLGGSPVKMCKQSNEKRFLCGGEPAPADAYPDLVCQFYTADVMPFNNSLVFLKGLVNTSAGPRGFGGQDYVTIVP